VKAGLKVRGVPTSVRTGELATAAGIPLVELADAIPIDITFDGADEVDPHLNLIKGYGRALLRESIVAAASKRLVILIGPEHVEEKLVPVLGHRGRLPVEVVPFALPLCRTRIAELGFDTDVLDADDGTPFRSDNGNHILHLRTKAIENPAGLEFELRAIPGVVGTGLFLGMASEVIVERSGKVEVLSRK
jgi:ribose 5-phosphate isomerase A